MAVNRSAICAGQEGWLLVLTLKSKLRSQEGWQAVSTLKIECIP